jgi:ELWxxDGT repeat protein
MREIVTSLRAMVVLIAAVMMPAAIPASSSAATATLVKDIAAAEFGSVPHSFTNGGQTAYFVSTDRAHGRELWRTDGSAAGTKLVKDVNPGPADSDSSEFAEREFANVGGTRYFTADDGTNGVELWKTDGTEAGTKLVKNIASGSANSSPASLTPLGNKLYFVASGGGKREVWVSDGTPTGTRILKDINGLEASDPADLENVNGTLYFTAAERTAGRQLWRSNGTGAGTVRVTSISGAGSGPCAAEGLCAVDLTGAGGTLFFRAPSGSSIALWKSDGTAAGTSVVKSGPVDFLHAFGDRLLFEGHDVASGSELWISDGTVAGTHRAADIQPGAGSGLEPHEVAFTNHAGFAYFPANDGVSGLELWRTDGSAGGTSLVHDVRPGSAGSEPSRPIATGGHLLFTANDGVAGRELWRSDGSAVGTTRITDTIAGAGDSVRVGGVALGDRAVISARDPEDGYEPWISDGTPGGTIKLANIETRTADSDPALLAIAGGRAYYSIEDGEHGRELWSTDGTGAGTQLVADINPGPPGSSPQEAVAVGDQLFFQASDGVTGLELWVTDGTNAGTVRLTELSPGIAPQEIFHPIAFNGELYFRADPANADDQIWKSDGTPEGTGPVLPGYRASVHMNPAVYAGRLYYFGVSPSPGLWSTDGTPSGTQLVASHAQPDTDLGAGSSATAGGRLYFGARTLGPGSSTLPELWSTDGTPAGTLPVDPRTDGQSWHGHPREITAFGDALLFQAGGAWSQLQQPRGNVEPWVSDGTQAGTRKLKDIHAKSSSNPHDFTVVGDRAYFAAVDDTAGKELWRTNGTLAGTAMVKSTYPGAGGSVRSLAAHNGLLYFVAATPAHGSQLWRSNGTAQGTNPVLGLNQQGGGVEGLAPFGNALLVVGDDDHTGTELWRVDP